MRRSLIILGSTGSIGTQTLDVVAYVNDLYTHGKSPVGFDIVGLAGGHGRTTLLAEQARRFSVPNVASCATLDRADLPTGCRVFDGPGSAEALVRSVECDLVVAAIVGVAGLASTLAAVEAGRDIALANKETLVAGGALVIPLAKAPASNVCLLPVDSEHSAAWQCMLAGLGPVSAQNNPRPHEWCPPWIRPLGLKKLTLTASGGPFRTWSRDRMTSATPADALNHPTWRMGPKVTVDSASLMNKALEIIEARWLFDLAAEQIDVLVHPQSTIHAMVEFIDGTVIAQMAAPDMRTPIQAAITWPARVSGVGKPLAFASSPRLDLETPDPTRFPALRLAYDVVRAGGTSGAILNAANELAVNAFLNPARGNDIPFGAVVDVVAECLASLGTSTVRSLADVMDADRRAREFVARRLDLAPRAALGATGD